MVHRSPVVVVGLGNPLMADDGIGAVLVERLGQDGRIRDVEFVEAGTPGLGLLHLLDGRRRAILVDCTVMGEAPGTIRRFTLEEVRSARSQPGHSLHQADVLAVLNMGASLGQLPEEVVIYGIEPQRVGPGLEISEVLRARLDEYVQVIRDDLTRTRLKTEGTRQGEIMARGKILIVDDDPDIVEAMRVVLENRGYSVSAAADSTEGKERIAASRPDLLILDVMMTRSQEGFELARDLRQDPQTKDIPILMITSVKAKTGIDFGAEAGDETWLPVDDFLDKPVKPDILLKKVETLLAGS